MNETRSQTEVPNSFILFGRMAVRYEGRASSTLEVGSYLLIRKPDGSTSIHGGDLNIPLNYQPAGSRMYQDGWKLTVTSKKEMMEIDVIEILSIYRPKEWDANRITIIKTERDLRTALTKEIHKHIPNAISTKEEIWTEYGPIDLTVIDSSNVKHIFEIKRAAISINAVTQVRKYMEALQTDGSIVRGYVSAPTIYANALKYAEKHGITFIEIKHA